MLPAEPARSTQAERHQHTGNQPPRRPGRSVVALKIRHGPRLPLTCGCGVFLGATAVAGCDRGHFTSEESISTSAERPQLSGAFCCTVPVLLRLMKQPVARWCRLSLALLVPDWGVERHLLRLRQAPPTRSGGWPMLVSPGVALSRQQRRRDRSRCRSRRRGRSSHRG